MFLVLKKTIHRAVYLENIINEIVESVIAPSRGGIIYKKLTYT